MHISFTKAILRSRWAFSIIFTISAVLIEETQCVPAVIIEAYRESTNFATSNVLPEVILRICVSVCELSLGFMRSGEYPR